MIFDEPIITIQLQEHQAQTVNTISPSLPSIDENHEISEIYNGSQNTANTIGQKDVKISKIKRGKNSGDANSSNISFKQRMLEIRQQQEREFQEQNQVKEYLGKISPEEYTHLKRHSRLIFEDLERSKFLSDKKYNNIKQLFKQSIHRYIAICKNNQTPYIKKLKFAGQKNPFKNA